MRTPGRSHVELGATLAAVRRLTPMQNMPNPSERPMAEQVLLEELRDEVKSVVADLSPRSLASALFNLATLRAADKRLFKTAVDVIDTMCVPPAIDLCMAICTLLHLARKTAAGAIAE